MIITEREARKLGDLIVRMAVIPLLATALLLASPGAAFAQSVGEDQYTNADPGQQQGEYTNAVPSQDQSGGNQQAPVGPGDPANPGSTSQTPETFEQTLTGILTDLNSISQILAVLNQDTTPPVSAQDPNAAPATTLPVPTAPASVITGGTGTVPVPVTTAPTAVVPSPSPGQAPVAVVNPLAAVTGAASGEVVCQVYDWGMISASPGSSCPGQEPVVIGGGDQAQLDPANSAVYTLPPLPLSPPTFPAALAQALTSTNNRMFHNTLFDDPHDVDGDGNTLTDNSPNFYDPDKYNYPNDD